MFDLPLQSENTKKAKHSNAMQRLCQKISKLFIFCKKSQHQNFTSRELGCI